ncbi:MAG: nuclear transport factor 2 family protein [Proteobacteria bacterium]|nr:nuclear transport factor 2 family protein [Pseudomonadota bacterium]
MIRFDPHSSWKALDQRAQTETNPQRKALTIQVRDHVEHEIKGNLDKLMNTLTAQPIYHFWGNGNPMVIEGWQAVHEFYNNMIAGGANQFQIVLDNIIADEKHLVTEGQVRQVYRGSALVAMGVQNAGKSAIKNDGLYLSETQLVTVWPADPDGKLIGEDIYFGEQPLSSLTPIDQSELPTYYKLI